MTFPSDHTCLTMLCLIDHSQPKKLAKPPLPASTQLANQVISYIQTNPLKIFPQHNEPQLTAIRAALTRRLTLIQGPPGIDRLMSLNFFVSTGVIHHFVRFFTRNGMAICRHWEGEFLHMHLVSCSLFSYIM